LSAFSTIWDYYDGVRSGIAEYSGTPHHYDCEWDEGKDDYSDTFVLSPVDGETLSLALEQWEIWREWEHKFHQGAVSQSTHPALPGQHERYVELQAILDKRLSDTLPSKRARAIFRPLVNQTIKISGIMRELEVHWETIHKDEMSTWLPSS